MMPKHPHHNPGFLALVNDAKSRIRETTIVELQSMQTAGADFLLVDVREDHEWQAGHATGAVHLGKGIIERDIETRVPDKGKALVLYCGGGFRSALAADALRQMGYIRVTSLAGGWRAYIAAGLPAEK
jgi:rhodanese-related sulfurtransferase